MPGYFNIDKAVKHIKTIADNNRCNTCDKLLSLRLRYTCGHIACKECVEESDECLICFNSLQKVAPVIDTVQSQHVKNVFNLLTVFQETFNIDVNKRHRLSEKIKEEQQFFSECIQASMTYHNKRRSSQIYPKKENLTPFVIAGEQISCVQSLTMNTRINLVQKWLESNENIHSPARKPFADINVNRSYIPVKENNDFKNSKQLNSRKYGIKKTKNNVNKNKYIRVKQKKTLNNLSVPTVTQHEHLKTIKDENPKTELTPNKISNAPKSFQFDDNQTDINYPNENLDIVVIEDTPTQEFDKDKEAWLAVLETEKNKLDDDYKEKNNTDNKPITQSLIIVPTDVLNNRKNVSYYKKAPLYPSCKLSFNGCNDGMAEYQKLHSNDVFITVNTSNITTSIKITNSEHITNFKNTISTQTVDFNKETNKDMCITSIPTDEKQSDITSEDLFVKDTNLFAGQAKVVEKENLKNNDLNETSDSPYQVISDSESDSEVHCSGTFEVIAEVYTPSKKDYGVLSEIKENDYQRLRQACRRRTIDSNNSSEKENVEPNRPKKPRMGKKPDKKKELM